MCSDCLTKRRGNGDLLRLVLTQAKYGLSRNAITEGKRLTLAYSIIGLGVVFSSLLILAFNGVFTEISIPPEYRALYE